MTEDTQELGEILDEFLTDIYMNNEHFAANQEALDKTKEEPMQAIIDWHNKQIEAVLDRLWHNSEVMNDDVNPVYGVPQSAIEAERAKLKEEK